MTDISPVSQAEPDTVKSGGDDVSEEETVSKGGTVELARLDEVEVELQAVVGRLSVSLADLRLLGEGQVVEFSTPVESPAILSVNGRAVATGELVDVGGRVGVRILSMGETERA